MATERTPRRAGIGGAFYVVLIVFGLLIVIGVIIWMMKAGGGIKHSPQQSALPDQGQVCELANQGFGVSQP